MTSLLQRLGSLLGKSAGENPSFVSLKRPEQLGLTNPSGRSELRADFPDGVDREAPLVMELIATELAKSGVKIEDVKRVNIAYPHKDPVSFPDHLNPAEKYVGTLKSDLAALAPSIDWILASGIVETKKLGRRLGGFQHPLLYAIEEPQLFIYRPELQMDFFPFAKESGLGQEYFLIVDDIVVEGTTAANLANYLEYNHGNVLGVAATESRLAQKFWGGRAELHGNFADRTRNTLRLPEMAEAFAKSARRDKKKWSPQECMERFESALNRLGSTALGLTNGECTKIINSVEGYTSESFPEILEGLKQVADQRPASGPVP